MGRHGARQLHGVAGRWNVGRFLDLQHPLIFTTGTQSIMQGVEILVIGMSVGESKTEKIPPDSIYGPYHPELACEVSRSWLRAQGESR